MKTKLIYILGITIGMTLLGACEDSLEIPQQGATSVDQFYKTDADATEAIAAVYSSWRGVMFTDFFVKNLLSDDIICGGGSRGDNNQFEQLNEFTFGPAHSSINDLFSGYYEIIYLSNLVINRFDPSESEVKARTVAEAKVARAWSYFNLVTLWGPVPLVLTELAPSEYQQPNGNVSAIWTQIEKDLSEAIGSNALPEKESPGDKTPGARLTRHAAMAFLGKAQLFQDKFSEAAVTLKAVINADKYELQADYGNILRQATDFGPESIFEINSLQDADNAFDQGINLWGPMVGWRSDKMNLNGYWTGAHELYPTGWGFVNPNDKLYEAFVAEEGADGYRLNNSILTYNQVLAMGITINSGTSLYGHEGYFSWKHRFIGSEVISNSFGLATANNLRLMRYAEVLLMAAEACFESGEPGNALDYVNEVRARAQLDDLTSLTIEDIKLEKRLELWGEQVRFQDLVRWGDAQAMLGEQGKTIPVFAGLNEDGSFNVQRPYTNSVFGFKTGKHELLPFPDHEMTVNQNIVQNPQW